MQIVCIISFGGVGGLCCRHRVGSCRGTTPGRNTRGCNVVGGKIGHHTDCNGGDKSGRRYSATHGCSSGVRGHFRRYDRIQGDENDAYRQPGCARTVARNGGACGWHVESNGRERHSWRIRKSRLDHHWNLYRVAYAYRAFFDRIKHTKIRTGLF